MRARYMASSRRIWEIECITRDGVKRQELLLVLAPSIKEAITKTESWLRENEPCFFVSGAKPDGTIDIF